MTELEAAYLRISELTKQREQLKKICWRRDVCIEDYGYFDEDFQPDPDEDEE